MRQCLTCEINQFYCRLLQLLNSEGSMQKPAKQNSVSDGAPFSNPECEIPPDIAEATSPRLISMSIWGLLSWKL